MPNASSDLQEKIDRLCKELHKSPLNQNDYVAIDLVTYLAPFVQDDAVTRVFQEVLRGFYGRDTSEAVTKALLTRIAEPEIRTWFLQQHRASMGESLWYYMDTLLPPALIPWIDQPEVIDALLQRITKDGAIASFKVLLAHAAENPAVRASFANMEQLGEWFLGRCLFCGAYENFRQYNLHHSCEGLRAHMDGPWGQVQRRLRRVGGWAAISYVKTESGPWVLWVLWDDFEHALSLSNRLGEDINLLTQAPAGTMVDPRCPIVTWKLPLGKIMLPYPLPHCMTADTERQPVTEVLIGAQVFYQPF